MKNTFAIFLDLLNVKHTGSFSNQCFNEHPHKYNLFGLSKMLSDYGVENAATRISDKENDISEIEVPLYSNIGVSLLILISLAGVYISWLLTLKQTHVQSQYADKICSLFKQKDCNNVLESKAAKLFGVIGLSEIGLGYFLTNILLLLFIPSLLPYIVLINILTLPFTLWSVWYQ